MLQNAGVSIPSWVSPCLERPIYTNPSFQSVHCHPLPGKFTQDAVYPAHEGNYPTFLPELQTTSRGIPVPSWTPWHPRPQNLPFLGHSYGGEPLYHGYRNDMIPYDDPAQSYPQKRKRARTTFSAEQLRKLEKRFHGNHYIVGDERLKISKDLNLSEAQVKVWFQNRRIKFKREEELEKLGLKKKRKGEHHVKRWQVVTKNFGPDTAQAELFRRTDHCVLKLRSETCTLNRL